MASRGTVEEVIAGGAIRVFGLTGTLLPSVSAWNDPDLWRAAFDGLADGTPFFAENFLGEQYRIVEGEVTRWDPDTCDHELCGADLDGWLARVRADPAGAAPLWMHEEWEATHGALSTQNHLAPRVPYVLGGEYSLDNVRDLDSVTDLRLRATLATRIRDLPDGASIEFDVP